MAKAAARAKSNSNDVDSSPPSKNVASSKKSKKVQEDEEMVEDVVDDAVEDEEDEEEAYEIERIVKGQMGKNQKGKMAFLVKWKGYPDAENSWINEEDFNERELLDEFIKKNAPAAKASAKPRASNVSTRKSEVTQPKRKPAPKEEVEESDEEVQVVEDSEEEKEPPKKRGRQSQSKAASSKRDHSESMDVDEAPPPKKKTKTPATKKRNPSPDEEDEAEETTVHDHSVDVLKKYMKFKDWTDIIEKIDTVEGTGDDLLCYFTTKKGEKAIASSDELRERAPNKLIDFYEAHLRWRAVQGTA